VRTRYLRLDGDVLALHPHDLPRETCRIGRPGVIVALPRQQLLHLLVGAPGQIDNLVDASAASLTGDGGQKVTQFLKDVGGADGFGLGHGGKITRGDAGENRGASRRGVFFDHTRSLRIALGSLYRARARAVSVERLGIKRYFADHLHGVNIECPSKVEKHVERWVEPPSFETTQIDHRKVGAERQLFLRHLPFIAEAPQCDAKMCLCFHMASWQPTARAHEKIYLLLVGFAANDLGLRKRSNWAPGLVSGER